MKYDPLKWHLAKLTSDEWRARFSDIEKVLGFSLPSSARKHPAWWANEPKGHPHANGWLEAGWTTTEVDLAAERLIFRRGRLPRSREKHATTTASKTPKAEEGPWPWDISRSLLGTLKLSWHPLGRVILSEGMRLRFPTAPKAPGLYRFTVRHRTGEQRYIGESQDLYRRFNSNYRSPTPRQQTSWRINKVFIDALAAGAQISVSIATESLSLSLQGQLAKIDLSKRAVRRLFEHFAQVCEQDEPVETLNR